MAGQHHHTNRGRRLRGTTRPDTVLLRRELRWTGATMLALGAAGYVIAGPYGAAIGSGAGFLVQQAACRLVVRALWRGWWMRSVTVDGAERAEEMVRISLRAFTLWMRTAGCERAPVRRAVERRRRRRRGRAGDGRVEGRGPHPAGVRPGGSARRRAVALRQRATAAAAPVAAARRGAAAAPRHRETAPRLSGKTAAAPGTRTATASAVEEPQHEERRCRPDG